MDKTDKSMLTLVVTRNYFCGFQMRNLFTKTLFHLTYTVTFNICYHLFNNYSNNNIKANQNMTVLTREISVQY